MFSRIVRKFSFALNWVGIGLLGLVVSLTTLDVVLRYFFNRPIKGGFELTQLAMAGIGALAIAHTQALKAHVRMDLVMDHLPIRTQLLLDTLMYIAALALLGMMAYYTAELGAASLRVREATDTLHIPVSPFKLLVPLGAIALCLELAVDLLETLKKLLRGKH